jgi:hypothetical protein
MTPFELRLCLEARNEDLVDDRAKDLWVAWHTAYLGRVDKFPHLGELMPKILEHKTSKDDKDGGGNRPKSSVGIDLMNALLKLPAAPPPPNAESIGQPGSRVSLDASDEPSPACSRVSKDIA